MCLQSPCTCKGWTIQSNIHPCCTRNRNKYDVNFCRRSKAYNAWQNLGLRLLNVLPSSAKNVTNTHFEEVVLKWLVNKALYSIQDYFKITVYDIKL